VERRPGIEGVRAVLVGVVSDTHDNIDAVRKASRIFLDKGAEMVLHLGDVVSPFTLRFFHESGVRVLHGVYGNNCGEKVGLRRVAERYGYSIEEWPRVIEAGGRKIVMVHGNGPADQTREMVDALAASGRYDVVLYGHTHRPDKRRVGGTLILNPGEACGCLTGRMTVALLDLATLEPEILEL